MGTITERRRKDGTVGHTAQIRIKQNGRVVHSESETFDRRQAARLWMKKREGELAEPGALGVVRKSDPTLAQAIVHYVKNSQRALGSTKEQVLRAIAADDDLASLQCSQKFTARTSSLLPNG